MTTPEMTLRDWFAGRVAPSLVMMRVHDQFNEYKDSFVGFEMEEDGCGSDASAVAEQAYIIADEMVAESKLPPRRFIGNERKAAT